MYDFSQHIVFNRSAFQNVYYEFDYLYSSYFIMEATTGVLSVRRALYPTSFSVRIEVEYDVTLNNGTVVSDDEYVYATIIAIGEEHDISTINVMLINILRALDCHYGT